MPEPEHILFFDGECVMCNGIVKWLYARDRTGKLKFASLQGERATEMRQEHPDFPTELDTFVFYDEGSVRIRSQAAFHTARLLGFPWKLAYMLRILPRFLTDAVYRFIARRRYAWFGRTESCWIPPADAKHRFLP